MKFLIVLLLVTPVISSASSVDKCQWFKNAPQETILQQAVFHERIRQDIRQANPRTSTTDLSNTDLVYIASKMYCDPKFDKRFLKQMIGQK